MTNDDDAPAARLKVRLRATAERGAIAAASQADRSVLANLDLLPSLPGQAEALVFPDELSALEAAGIEFEVIDELIVQPLRPDLVVDEDEALSKLEGRLSPGQEEGAD